jgi:hypothetical protein
MANNSDNYATVSENEESSDEIIEITPVPIVKKKRDVQQRQVLVE